jgi:hypothetical protein
MTRLVKGVRRSIIERMLLSLYRTLTISLKDTSTVAEGLLKASNGAIKTGVYNASLDDVGIATAMCTSAAEVRRFRPTKKKCINGGAKSAFRSFALPLLLVCTF